MPQTSNCFICKKGWLHNTKQQAWSDEHFLVNTHNLELEHYTNIYSHKIDQLTNQPSEKNQWRKFNIRWVLYPQDNKGQGFKSHRLPFVKVWQVTNGKKTTLFGWILSHTHTQTWPKIAWFHLYYTLHLNTVPYNFWVLRYNERPDFIAAAATTYIHSKITGKQQLNTLLLTPHAII